MTQRKAKLRKNKAPKTQMSKGGITVEKQWTWGQLLVAVNILLQLYDKLKDFLS